MNKIILEDIRKLMEQSVITFMDDKGFNHLGKEELKEVKKKAGTEDKHKYKDGMETVYQLNEDGEDNSIFITYHKDREGVNVSATENEKHGFGEIGFYDGDEYRNEGFTYE